MSIVLDAMGGDHAPEQIVAGALQAIPELRHPLILVGEPSALRRFLPSPLPPNLIVHPASQAVGMDEKPLDAYRKKKDSSIMVGSRLVKEGQGKAFVSAGNTGAVSAAALLTWRQVPAIHRPAIVTRLPNRHGGFALVDAGASPDVEAEHMVGFAIMGRAYAQTIMGRQNARVHLLNIGEEPGKGNKFAKEVFRLLSRYDWFAGNIEGKDMYAQPCDVVVCDAFVGNVVLKTSEGIAELIVASIRDAVPANPILRLPFLPLRGVLQKLRKQMDYAETGGSPLLGLNELCMICHGRSNAKAIKNALLLTQKALEGGLVDTIRKTVAVELASELQAEKQKEHESSR